MALVVDDKASVMYEGGPERFVVTWNDVKNAKNSNRQTFQIVLYRDGTFKIQHKALTNDVPSAIGVENCSGRLGVSCGRPDDYLSGAAPKLVALVFSPPDTWFGR